MEIIGAVIHVLFQLFTYLFIAYMIVVIGFYSVMLVISSRQLREQYGLNQKEPYEDYLDNIDAKPVSVIVPAYNEEIGIYNSVRALLSMNYSEYEIIVVNDGSKDQTVDIMIDKFDMKKIPRVVRKQLDTESIRGIYQSSIHSNVFMVDKENGGKADALNAGINVSRYPYVCSLDGDSILERDAFLKVMKPIIESDGEVIAAGGSIRIANGCRIERGEVMEIGLSKSPLVVMQVIEYLRAFLMGRIGLSRHNLLLIISGAFGIFHKESVIRAGGYRRETVGEDMELVVRLHRLMKEEKEKSQIVYLPDPVCWTEAPEDTTMLKRQRSRWHRGLFESLWHHKRMLFNPRYGSIGMISVPYFVFIELIGPVIELLGYILVPIGVLTGLINVQVAILMFLLALLYGSILSMGAVLLEEWSLRRYPKESHIVRLFFYALSETFWYRPLTVFWRMLGLIQVVRKQQGWGEMKRKGISQ
ncbi:glycosyltransferase family 2 protein [Pontibacillus salipaludis]|uniref:Glycosyl transferase n=1 Tax=Pontibacillus salipaludis TaxID=1697394 RepID=A0ABQ1Q3M7_9BACI|nr:glycosyl transferase [Pontibacillus salipaludis]